MLRALLFPLLMAAVAACVKDSGPTTPGGDGLTPPGTVLADRDDDGGGGRPTADDVEASVVFTRTRGKFRECEGEDGHYFETRAVLTGVSTGDSRLTGKFEFRVRELFNVTQNLGPQDGEVIVTDESTRRIKAKGNVTNWGPADLGQGTITGVIRDHGVGGEPTSGNGFWIANWRVIYSGGGISAQIGGVATDNRIPAGVYSGGCTGKWTEFDVDIGAAGFAPQAVGRQRSWRTPWL